MTAPQNAPTTTRPEAVKAQPRPGETAWQRPDYRVVDTSLEVTAYGLNRR